MITTLSVRGRRRAAVTECFVRLAIAAIASSLHPWWARWQSRQVTPRRCYQGAEITFQQSARQFFVGGLHIHAGFGDPELRIRAMTALRQHLPLFLAASTSSPGLTAPLRSSRHT